MHRRAVIAVLMAVTGALMLTSAFLALRPHPAAPVLTTTADLTKFDPGNIISDAAFFNSSTMSVEDIQTFLNVKGANCSGAYCLKGYHADSNNRAAETSGCPRSYSAATGESAATIIYRVSQACGINPQVLLVTLQKESGLVTATAPTASKYRYAMGYACPDTAPCDQTYVGLFNQVYMGARAFQRYKAGAVGGYHPGRWNSIYYNPDPGCGSSQVYIQNQATAGLYDYTPYQPNQAALNAGYGLGNSCSAYGNRNFYAYFNDWFSGPQAILNRAAAVNMGGAATGTVKCDLPGGGCWQPYPNGIIYWSSATGAWEVRGAILAKYQATGGPGYMGYPMGADVPVAGARVTTYDTVFQQGDIVWTGDTGAQLVRGAIAHRWAALGKSTGSMGVPTTSDATAPGGGYVVDFEGGSIYWSPGTGAWEVRGAILAKYRATGGPGYMGYPRNADVPVAGARVTTYDTAFEQGDIVWTGDTGAQLVRGAIATRWAALGKSTGALGVPVTSDAEAPGGGGYVVDFEGGSIYWSPATGAHDVRGAILAKYRGSGGPAYMGYPSSDDQPDPKAPGVYDSSFEQGDIVWTSATGAQVVRGAIATRWAALGKSGGALGVPVAGYTEVAGTTGAVVEFQGGRIYSSPSTGAHDVRGAILARYEALDGPGGALGFPVGDDSWDPSASGVAYSEFEQGDIVWTSDTGALVLSKAIAQRWVQLGRSGGALGIPVTDDTAVGTDGHVVTFKGGSIYSSPTTGAHDVRGAILAKYQGSGGPGGPLGFPVGNDSWDCCAAGVAYTNFQHGDVVWSSGSDAHIVLNGPVRDRWLALKASSGPLGVPVADDATVGTAGHVGKFRGGSIYWSGASTDPAHDVRGAILAKYEADGGPTGPLGFPTTSDAVAPGGAGYVLDFEHGSIYWTSTTKAHIVRAAVNAAYLAAGGTTSTYGYPVSDTYTDGSRQRNDFQHGSLTG